MKMRSERELVITLLKGPAKYAHSAGKEMQAILDSGRRNRVATMHRIADQHFETIMKMFSVEQVSCIIKTWLCTYSIPFDSSRLKYFDQFHRDHAQWIFINKDIIVSY